jgi:cytochrome b
MGPRTESGQVWDLPLRIFHWALALLVIAQVTTATIGGNAMEYHALGGYAILALLLFRLVWGFAGGTHARFANFVRGPGAVLGYLRGRIAPGDGHTPLGALSVVAMLLSLLVQATTGLFATDDVMMDGPLVKHVPGRVVEVATAVHDVNAYVLLGLVGLHVAAILFYLMVRRRNLILPMLTGRAAGAPGAQGGGLLRGAVVLGGAAAAVYFIVTS